MAGGHRRCQPVSGGAQSLLTGGTPLTREGQRPAQAVLALTHSHPKGRDLRHLRHLQGLPSSGHLGRAGLPCTSAKHRHLLRVPQPPHTARAENTRLSGFPWEEGCCLQAPILDLLCLRDPLVIWGNLWIPPQNHGFLIH